VRADVLVQQLFDEWAAAAARGERPDTLAYLRRAGHHADELASLIEAFRRAEPRREPDEQTRLLTRAWIAGESPLVVLRVGRGLRRDDVVEAIEREFALPAEKRRKLKDYYHQLEAGLLEPRGLNGRLVELLARLLETSPANVLGWRARPLAAEAAFRAVEAPAQMAMPAVMSQDVERDEIDALFRGGTSARDL
jgi:hypothetical protein